MDMRNRRPSPVVLRLRSSYAFRAMKLDQQEREAVLRALSVLPHDHPARIAFDQGADPVALMQLLEGDETVENLKEIWLAAYERRCLSGCASRRSEERRVGKECGGRGARVE